jgi:peroxiredoxin Q/BCP
MIEPGTKAPAFTANDQAGNKVKLSDFKGKKVILYFYPEDDTPTCTEEACNLRDNHHLLQKHGFVVLGVSPDDEAKHQKFIQKFDLPFTLLADPKHKLIEKYGVWGEKNMYGRKYMGIHRTTYVIDEKGKVEHLIRKVRSKDHAGQILALYQK